MIDLSQIPTIGARRIDPYGDEWVVIGVGAIVRDAILLVQRIKDAKREHILASEWVRWMPAWKQEAQA